MAAILQIGLAYGLVLSVLFSAVIVVSLHVNPLIWAGDMPPALRALYPPPDARTRRHKRLFAVLMFLPMIVLIALAVARVGRLRTGAPGFADLFLVVAVVGMVVNLVDLLVLDWLWVETFKPRGFLPPGVDGPVDFGGRGYHFVAFLKGIAGILVMAAVAGGLATLAYRLF